MRKVQILKYEKVLKEAVGDYSYELVNDYIGSFHGWGVDYEHDSQQYTAAIIESPNGEVKLLHINLIRFLGLPE